MASYGGDQASGLRRLFGRKATRVVAFVAGGAGVGKSVLVANLAASLARQGREVLVIDENTRRNVASCFGVLARHDLWQVINREKSLAEVMLAAAPGVRILPAASAVGELGKLDQAQQASLLEILSGIERVPDVILVDASADHPLGFSPLGLAAHDAVVVMSGSGPSITDAYALVKKVSLAYARRNFRVILNKVRGGDEAASIHANMAQLTRSRGFAHIEYAGFVPLDEQVQHAARLGQPVVHLFPDAPAAKAYRTIASELLGWPLPVVGRDGIPGAGSDGIPSAGNRALSEGDDGGLEQFVRQLLHLSQHIDPIAIYA